MLESFGKPLVLITSKDESEDRSDKATIWVMIASSTFPRYLVTTPELHCAAKM